jgi:transposase
MMLNGIHLDYQDLREISHEAARQALLQVYKSTGGNASETARLLKVSRPTVYKAIRKHHEGDLSDGSKVPHTIANKTPQEVEDKVVEIKSRTNYGPIRIADELQEVHGISLSIHTIRNIVRRNRGQIKAKRHKPHKKAERAFVDWYSAKAFEIVQIDLKYVVDQKALSLKQISHIYANKLPLYQWSAIDVNSRFKLIAYSDEKSWTNGLTWFLWVTSWLRSHGVDNQIIYTVDRGEEFGGKSWLKTVELKKLLSGFNCQLIQNHVSSPQENAHLERSHRTDDDEFYIPKVHQIPNRQEWFKQAFNYIYYYNVVRKHSGLNRKTPFQHLKQQMPNIDDRIRLVPPLILDKISVDLGPWSGYHLLAHHQS